MGVKAFRHLLPLAFVIASGCATYKEMPLTRPALDAALATPDSAALASRAGELRHPLLPRMPIDPRKGLTPDSAAVIAVIVNPSLRAERDRRSLACAQLLEAGILPNPTIDFTLDPVTGGNTAGAITAYSVGLSWEITSLITHDAKVKAGQAQLQSVQLDVAWQEWQVAQAAKKAVYDVVALRGQLSEAATVDHQLAENAALMRRAMDAGQKTRLDFAAAEAASQKAHTDFLAARGDLRHQELMLNETLGLPPLSL